MKAMILFLMIAAMPVRAAQERGNGGDGFLCQDGRVHFYDLIEMDKRFHITPDIPAGASWPEIAGQLIDRLQAINPSRAYRFHRRLESFLSEADFLTGVTSSTCPTPASASCRTAASSGSS